MDKAKLYLFSIDLKRLLSLQKASEVEQEIVKAGLSQSELDFVFMCLRSDGYDPKTNQFTFYHSDNSAFLALVQVVQSKISGKK